MPPAPLFSWSDLHLEHWGWKAPLRRDDPALAERRRRGVLVLAGDVSDGDVFERAVAWLKEWVPAHFLACVLVLGNHEFHGAPGGLEATTARWLAEREGLRERGIHLLVDDVLELHGHRFVGTTLWTDPTVTARGCRPWDILADVADYQRVPGLNLDQVRYRHRQHLAFLEEVLLAEGPPVVVVTHHLPSFECVDERYRNETTNAAFACEVRLERFARRVQVWLHGHTHQPVDKVIRGVHVVCHPRGHRGESGADQPRELTLTSI